MADTPPLGQIIDTLYLERKKLRSMTEELKKQEALLETLSEEVQQILDTNQMTMARGTLGSVSITETDMPNVEDWDKYYEYIKETDQLFLLERRPAAGAYRELINSGHEVPGVKTFKRRKLSIRAV